VIRRHQDLTSHSRLTSSLTGKGEREHGTGIASTSNFDEADFKSAKGSAGAPRVRWEK